MSQNNNSYNALFDKVEEAIEGENIYLAHRHEEGVMQADLMIWNYYCDSWLVEKNGVQLWSEEQAQDYLKWLGESKDVARWCQFQKHVIIEDTI